MAQLERPIAHGDHAAPDGALDAAGTRPLRRVAKQATAPAVVPLKADVLVIGNSTRTLAALRRTLADRGLTSRATLEIDEVFGLSARQLPDLLLFDDDAAELDTIDLARRVSVHRRLGDVPMVIVSASDDTRRKVEAFSAGVIDYVCTPVDTAELLARVLAHVRVRREVLESQEHSRRLEGFVLEQVSEISDSQMATIIALAKLAESRDDQTGGHLERVQKYCRMLASKLSEQMRFGIIDQTFIDNIEYASALHDIGKVAISDLILLKPSELDAAEFELMKTHTLLGAQTLEAVSEKYPNNDFIEMGIKIARWHHERWDGTGYPDGLVGDDIPLSARIMAVADVYDALMSQRSYKHSLTHAESRDLIVAESSEHFDPDVIEAFVTLAEEFERVSGE